MGKLVNFCDYFVIASGTSLRQINTIGRAIVEELEKEGVYSSNKVLAEDESGWLALDFGAVIVHIFYKPLREFYALEELWSDAKKLRLPRKQHL